MISTFRQASKALRMQIQAGIAEAVTQDYATCFAFGEAINNRMLEAIGDAREAGAREHDQLQGLNQLFGNGEVKSPVHLVNATKCVKCLLDRGIHDFTVGLEYELRKEKFLPPLIKKVTIFRGDDAETYVDNGEFCETE